MNEISENQIVEAAPAERVEAIKGFDANMQCRGYQFEVGAAYRHDGPVKICESGFHAIEGHPLEVFTYYPPAGSRYAIVEQWGDLGRHSGDSKLVSASISVKVEISLAELTARAVKWVFDRAKWVDGPVATGDNEAATASGYRGAATASGYRGAATASGYQGAATASGDQGAATASGYQGAATASGDQGAATASGHNSVAVSTGIYAKARGALGTAICLVHRDDETGEIIAIRATKIGENGTEPDVFYTLSRDGEFVKVEG